MILKQRGYEKWGQIKKWWKQNKIDQFRQMGIQFNYQDRDHISIIMEKHSIKKKLMQKQIESVNCTEYFQQESKGIVQYLYEKKKIIPSNLFFCLSRQLMNPSPVNKFIKELVDAIVEDTKMGSINQKSNVCFQSEIEKNWVNKYERKVIEYEENITKMIERFQRSKQIMRKINNQLENQKQLLIDQNKRLEKKLIKMIQTKVQQEAYLCRSQAKAEVFKRYVYSGISKKDEKLCITQQEDPEIQQIVKILSSSSSNKYQNMVDDKKFKSQLTMQCRQEKRGKKNILQFQ